MVSPTPIRVAGPLGIGSPAIILQVDHHHPSSDPKHRIPFPTISLIAPRTSCLPSTHVLTHTNGHISEFANPPLIVAAAPARADTAAACAAAAATAAAAAAAQAILAAVGGGVPEAGGRPRGVVGCHDMSGT